MDLLIVLLLLVAVFVFFTGVFVEGLKFLIIVAVVLVIISAIGRVFGRGRR